MSQQCTFGFVKPPPRSLAQQPPPPRLTVVLFDVLKSTFLQLRFSRVKQSSAYFASTKKPTRNAFIATHKGQYIIYDIFASAFFGAFLVRHDLTQQGVAFGVHSRPSAEAGVVRGLYRPKSILLMVYTGAFTGSLHFFLYEWQKHMMHQLFDIV